MLDTVTAPQRRLQSVVSALCPRKSRPEPVAESVGTAAEIVPSRPPVQERCFVSTAVEAAIEDIGGRMLDKQLAILFQNALPNTLDTTVHLHSPEQGAEDSCKSRGSACRPACLHIVLRILLTYLIAWHGHSHHHG